MEIIFDYYKNINTNKEISIAIGNFDGIHVGHQEIIQKLFENNFINPSILTFNPHPQSIFDFDYRCIFSVEEKVKNFSNFNLEYVLIVNFEKNFMSLSIDEFINFLKKINVVNIVVGKDFRFASKKQGSYKDLEKHFNVVVVEDKLVEDKKVSSTLIKNIIKSGDVENVYKYLGQKYYIEGNVLYGNQIGRLLNFPTANLDYTRHVLPKKGVYYAYVIYKDNHYNALVNIGNNPTVNYQENIRVEAYIYDFDITHEIYGEKIKVIFLKRKRDEIKFVSKVELINQLNNDKIEGSKYFKEEIK